MSLMLSTAVFPVSALEFMTSMREFSDKSVKKGSIGKGISQADKGDVTAQLFMAECYEKGIGVSADLKEALRYLNDALGSGDPRAHFLMGCFLMQGKGVAKDFVKAIEHFRTAAAMKLWRAQYNLGILLFQGYPGVAPNPIEGYSWVLRSLRQKGDRELEAKAKTALKEFEKTMKPDDVNKAKDLQN